jgi:cell fate (sporulation/competence/biofilm development) regulator YlbF (YheA/YmcA/DUF963 family)
VAKTSLDPEKPPTRSQRYNNSVAIWLQKQMAVRQTTSTCYDASSANFMTPIWFVTIDAFLADASARGQYETVMHKGQALQEKQSQGRQLESAEIADFEKHREALLNNPTARSFLDAREKLHEIQHSVQKYVSKTLELGRVPAAEDLQDHSCGDGCGCHH